MTDTTPDFAAIKAGQNAAWSSGDYAVVGALDAEMKASMQQDMLDLIARSTAAEDGTMLVPSAYLEVVIARR